MKKAILIAGILAAAAGTYIATTRLRGARSEEEKHGLASFKVPEGFTVELASKPGLLRYPMLGTIAPDGVMYMCESSGKTLKTPEMSAAPNYVITRLEDTDHDGVYDKSTVFAEKLTLPAGAVFYKDSLYVAAPPYLLRLQDTN